MNFAPAAGAPAGTTIHMPDTGLAHGLFELSVDDGFMRAYYAAPADPAKPSTHQRGLPIVLVIQEIFGLHEHIRDLCRRFAHAGYFAVAADLYQRQGDAAAYTDIPTLVSDIVSKVPDEQVCADLDACLRWAAAQGVDANRAGVTGFCWGGRLTWMYCAHNPAIRAGLAWYGKLTVGHGPLQTRHPIDLAGSLHAPVLGLYGGRDAGIPLADVERMRQALAAGNAAARASDVVVYPDAEHGFYADYRASYHARDAQDAWQRGLAWFGRHLAVPSARCAKPKDRTVTDALPHQPHHPL